MQVTAAHESAETAISGAGVKWRVCGHSLADGYEHATLNHGNIRVQHNERAFVPAVLPGLAQEGFNVSEAQALGPIERATALLLTNTPPQWLPAATSAYIQNDNDDMLAGYRRFPPLILLPQRAQQPWPAPVGAVFEPIGPDVCVRHVSAATLLSRALYVAGVCATHMLGVLGTEENLMRKAVNEAIK